MAERKNITIECNADFAYEYPWTDESGNPVDLTGAIIEAQLREFESDSDFFIFTCSHDDDGGTITLHMPHETTAMIPYTAGCYDVFITFPGVARKKVLYGTVAITPNVVRAMDGTLLYLLAVDSYEDLPTAGDLSRLYVAYDTGHMYRWNGTNYVVVQNDLTIGEVTTLPAYQPATASITGPANNRKLNLAIPRGPSGDDIIDDTAGEGITDRTWSADKIYRMLKAKDAGEVLYIFPQCTYMNEDITLIVTPTKTILIDAGRPDTTNYLVDFIQDLFDAGVIENIDYFILSHYHSDHYGSLSAILTNFSHEGCHAWIPRNISNTYLDTTTAYNAVKGILSTNGVTMTEVSEDITVPVDVFEDEVFSEFTIWNGTTAEWDEYDSSGSTRGSLNNYSLCVLFRHGNQYSLIPGDAYWRAQKNMVDVHDVPHLFLYRSNHHNNQTDDYPQFFDKINPENFVISMGRAVYGDSTREYDYRCNHDRSNHLLPETCRRFYLGYSPVIFSTNGFTSALIEGTATPSIVSQNSNADPFIFYVDNSYTGTIHDGTEEHPFTQIREALRFVRSNARTTLKVVPTETPYLYFRIKDFAYSLNIVSSDDNSKPILHGANLRDNAGSIIFDRIKFQGYTERPPEDSADAFIYLYSTDKVRFSDCDFVGDADSSISVIGIFSQSSTIILNTCTFSNLENAVSSNVYTKVFFLGGTFSNINRIVLAGGTSLAELFFRKGTYSITTCNYIVYYGNNACTFPINIHSTLAATFAPLLQDKAVSSPFFYSSTYPVAIVANNTIYDVLTGTDILNPPTP